MTLHIYNTLTRQKEEFVPLEEGKVRMYVCGPTVYADAHIGHAMSAIVFDMVHRYLEYLGYQVTYATNFTDVDDKIIQRAQATGRGSLRAGQLLRGEVPPAPPGPERPARGHLSPGHPGDRLHHPGGGEADREGLRLRGGRRRLLPG